MPFPNWRRFHHAFVKAGKWFHPGQILFRVELKHDVPRDWPRYRGDRRSGRSDPLIYINAKQCSRGARQSPDPLIWLVVLLAAIPFVLASADSKRAFRPSRSSRHPVRLK